MLPGVRFDRTVIKSKARFTYEQAQQIIEGKITSQNDIPKGFGCMDPKDDRVIFHDIITMNTIALNLRKRRIEGGSLIFETPKKSFTLN
jgi:exoribonuclease R